MKNMTEKRFSYDGVVIIDHLKKDLIYINGKENLLELAEYVDKLQEENEQLQNRIKELEIENQGQSDAIDGLQEMMAHYNLEDLE